ncbi:MAG: KfrB domain-containing protein [Pseudomonadota bacterium]
MKLRVIVMNGQRIVETEEDVVWKIQEVGKAGKLKPGIYNLYSSQRADKSKRHDGVIVHSADSYIYQQVGEIIVMHSQSDFYETLPEIGTNKRIVYDAQGKAKVSIAGTLTQNNRTE